MKYLLLSAAVFSFTLGSYGTVYATDQLKEEGNPNESLRVKEQKKAGILEEKRDYSKKSNFVENRDRVEGTVEQTGEVIKEGAEKLKEKVKTLF